MRTVFTGAVLAALLAGTALAQTPTQSQVQARVPQPTQQTCLAAADIREAKGEAGGASILFQMRGGNFQWRSPVTSCTGLAGSPVSWTSNAQGKVCDGADSKVWVQASASSCALGKFERILTLRGNGDVD